MRERERKRGKRENERERERVRERESVCERERLKKCQLNVIALHGPILASPMNVYTLFISAIGYWTIGLVQ